MQAPGRERGTAGPRLPKMPVLQDFQFFDTPRLLALYEQEHAYELHKHALATREAAAKAQVLGCHDADEILKNLGITGFVEIMKVRGCFLRNLDEGMGSG